MYRKLPESSGNVIGWKVDGEVTQQDVAEMQADIQTAIADHDTVRLVIDLEAMDELEPSAAWQDLTMLDQYAREVDRMAVIGDERWQEWSAKAAEVVSEAEFFPPDEADRAWAWAREGVSS